MGSTSVNGVESTRRVRSRFRKLFFGTLALGLGLLLAVALGEGLCSAYAYWQYGTIHVDDLLSRESSNAYVEDHRTGYTTTLYPHPYLNYVHNEKVAGEFPKHTTAKVNNVGFIGRDFPLKKDPTRFTILLTGGSVAEQLGRTGVEGQSYLEKALNERYRVGRDVVVLNGAIGGWTEPSQSVAYLLYGDVVDAVITLDGFNEMMHCKSPETRLEYPQVHFHMLNPVAGAGFDNLGIAWQTQQLRRIASEYNSRAVYFATRYLRQQLVKRVQHPTAQVSVETIFGFPEDWSKQDRMEYNIRLYCKYVRYLDAMAKADGAKRLFVLQPCPAIAKRLTSDELQVVGDLGYADFYRKVEADFLAMRDEGLPVVSLRDIFADVDEGIYRDSIHCKTEPPEEYDHAVNYQTSTGYRMMSDAIADQIAAAWKFPPRSEKPEGTR